MLSSQGASSKVNGLGIVHGAHQRPSKMPFVELPEDVLQCLVADRFGWPATTLPGITEPKSYNASPQGLCEFRDHRRPVPPALLDVGGFSKRVGGKGFPAARSSWPYSLRVSLSRRVHEQGYIDALRNMLFVR